MGYFLLPDRYYFRVDGTGASWSYNFEICHLPVELVPGAEAGSVGWASSKQHYQATGAGSGVRVDVRTESNRLESEQIGWKGRLEAAFGRNAARVFVRPRVSMSGRVQPAEREVRVAETWPLTAHAELTRAKRKHRVRGSSVTRGRWGET
ncbi:hypothetical protein RRG08_017098 [Elysia crispata]|uniref:Uncharacterized protein n=1 Tax=Elysia crispata TaxID=231223 RepID=A0AAE1DJ55_9GAST|nr:hypothetical protein RRG08_017098 [Elysia crispata]